MSEDIYGKITDDTDPIKKILSKVPGFSGYIEREKRRDSDKLLREIIADRLEEQWQRVSTLQKEFVSQGEISYLDDLESAAIKIRTLADRIRRASYGYAGIFDAVKINEDDLALLYSYDAALLDSVDEISRAIDNAEVSVGTDGLPAAIRNISTVTQDMTTSFNRRDETILSADQDVITPTAEE